MSLFHNPVCAKCGEAEYTLVGPREGNDYYECPLCGYKVDAYVTDESWRKTYPSKPEWWDDPTEPRCDVCGVHTEEALDHLKDAANNDQDRYPGGWCGECGNCADHCSCDNGINPETGDVYGGWILDR